MPQDGSNVRPGAAGSSPRERVAGLRVFDRYYLKRKLGQGGMGTVWLAHDRVLEQPVALKFLADHLVEDRREVDRLKAETRRCLKLAHPNIVRIHDFVQDARGAAIAMEFVDGWSLWTLKVDKPHQKFEVEEIAPWIRDLCAALEYAHTEAHLVHRDVKPANLLLNSRGQIKVTDFGLSRAIRRAGGPDEAHPRIVGTDLYMSPQQWTGEPPAVADDIYSLGVTIYELLTGQPPFHEGDVFTQLHELIPPSMTDRLHEFGVEEVAIPLAWEDTVAACLAKEAERRPVSAREVAARLGLLPGAETTPPEAAEEPAQPPPPPEPPPSVEISAAPTEPPTESPAPAPPTTRLPPVWVAAIAMGVVLMVAVIWLVGRGCLKLGPAAGTVKAPRAALEPGKYWENSLGMRFVSVPGTTVMFSIWETRVRDFEAFVRDTGFDTTRDMLTMNKQGQWRQTGRSWRNPDFPQSTNHPVVGVNWQEAAGFCDWLTRHEQKQGLIGSNQRYRLPTAAEWLQAAGPTAFAWGDGWPPPPRAGNFAGEELRDTLPKHLVVNSYRDGYPGTAPVGCFTPNPFGLFDLGGNAWEFCQDGPAEAPDLRWMMGASWQNFTREALSVSERGRTDLEKRYSNRGFRCVLVLAEEDAP